MKVKHKPTGRTLKVIKTVKNRFGTWYLTDAMVWVWSIDCVKVDEKGKSKLF